MKVISECEFSESLMKMAMKLSLDLGEAEMVLSRMLHVLRDNLPYDKAIVIYNALPEKMKVKYTKGWNSSEVEKPADRFCDLRGQFMKCESITDEKVVELYLVCVLELLHDYIPDYRLRRIIEALPMDIREALVEEVHC